LIDWFPTLLARAGQPLPADRILDGRDLWPVLTDRATVLHEALFGFQGTTLRAGALFDLESDPGEQHDVSAAQPAVVTRLRRLAIEHLAAARPR
jgi:hypothetical protein